MFDTSPSLQCGLHVLKLDVPRIMAIVNVTPDSFSDGGRLDTAQAAIAHALGLMEQGADMLDIGGESTRPNAAAVSSGRSIGNRCEPSIQRSRPRATARVNGRPTWRISADCVPPRKITGPTGGWRRTARARWCGSVL